MKPAHRADREAESRAAVVDAAGRRWWKLVPNVVSQPAVVFRALREDDDEDVAARQEPILAIVLLAGIAAAILTPTWGRLLDNGEIDGLIAVIITFIGGGVGGGVMYYVLGAALWIGLRGAGSLEPMRLARQIGGFAALPIAASLVVTLPIALVAFGGDFFRSGGSDGTWGRWVVIGIGLGFVAWSLGLIVLGLRAALDLPWRAVATTVAFASVAIGAVAVLPYVLSGP